MTTNLVIDELVDPEEGAPKDLAVDRISRCDVQFDCGVWNTKVEYVGCYERGVRSRELVGRGIVGQGGQPRDCVGRHGRQPDGLDGGESSSS